MPVSGNVIEPEPGKKDNQQLLSRGVERAALGPLRSLRRTGRVRGSCAFALNGRSSSRWCPMPYWFLADVVAGIHVAYVLAVVLGLVLILVGRPLGWTWVANRWFRGVHLGLIAAVVVRAMIWAECPLTWWERDLRTLARQQGFEASAVGRFLHDLVHPNLPLWVFPATYVTVGLLILGTFWLVPVSWRPRQRPAAPS